MFKYKSILAVMSLLALLSGCAEEKLPIYQIEGTVTLDGEPLDRISVEFVPSDQGPHSMGQTDESGRFKLSTYDQEEKQGVLASKCKVVLRDNSVFKEGIEHLTPSQKRGMDLSSGKKPRIADKYSNFMTTPLEFEVVGDNQSVEFPVEPYQG